MIHEEDFFIVLDGKEWYGIIEYQTRTQDDSFDHLFGTEEVWREEVYCVDHLELSDAETGESYPGEITEDLMWWCIEVIQNPGVYKRSFKTTSLSAR